MRHAFIFEKSNSKNVGEQIPLKLANSKHKSTQITVYYFT